MGLFVINIIPFIKFEHLKKSVYFPSTGQNVSQKLKFIPFAAYTLHNEKHKYRFLRISVYDRLIAGGAVQTQIYITM